MTASLPSPGGNSGCVGDWSVVALGLSVWPAETVIRVKMQSAITPAHANISANARNLRYMIPLSQTLFTEAPSYVDGDGIHRMTC